MSHKWIYNRNYVTKIAMLTAIGIFQPSTRKVEVLAIFYLLIYYRSQPNLPRLRYRDSVNNGRWRAQSPGKHMHDKRSDQQRYLPRRKRPKLPKGVSAWTNALWSMTPGRVDRHVSESLENCGLGWLIRPSIRDVIGGEIRDNLGATESGQVTTGLDLVVMIRADSSRCIYRIKTTGESEPKQSIQKRERNSVIICQNLRR
eukprot:Mrub_08967.p1 GENE.Mrub_08967~~Mrub_08967.p1  ORF type:complete len:201 (+),score=-6.98 Mrub_08967:61-663(+)